MLRYEDLSMQEQKLVRQLVRFGYRHNNSTLREAYPNVGKRLLKLAAQLAEAAILGEEPLSQFAD